MFYYFTTDEKQVSSNGIPHSTTDDSYPFITINGLCASWSENTTNLSLKDISFTVDKVRISQWNDMLLQSLKMSTILLSIIIINTIDNYYLIYNFV